MSWKRFAPTWLRGLYVPDESETQRQRQRLDAAVQRLQAAAREAERVMEQPKEG